MNNQDKKRLLRRYAQMEISIDRKLEELTRWRNRAKKITSDFIGVTPCCSDVDGLDMAVERIIGIENELNNMIDKCYNFRSDIESVIGKIPNEKMQQLLKKKYIDGKTFENIAYDMHYSLRQIYYLHRQALSLIDLTDIR